VRCAHVARNAVTLHKRTRPNCIGLRPFEIHHIYRTRQVRAACGAEAAKLRKREAEISRACQADFERVFVYGDCLKEIGRKFASIGVSRFRVCGEVCGIQPISCILGGEVSKV
jgi:hypothetical protein